MISASGIVAELERDSTILGDKILSYTAVLAGFIPFCQKTVRIYRGTIVNPQGVLVVQIMVVYFDINLAVFHFEGVGVSESLRTIVCAWTTVVIKMNVVFVFHHGGFAIGLNIQIFV